MATIFALLGTYTATMFPNTLIGGIGSSIIWGIPVFFWLSYYNYLNRTYDICEIQRLITAVNAVYVLSTYIYMFHISSYTPGLFTLFISGLAIIQAIRIPFYWTEIEDLYKS